MLNSMKITLSATLAVFAAALFQTTAAAEMIQDDGDQPGTTMGLGEIMFIFEGIQLALMIVLAVMIYAPAKLKGKELELKK